MTNACETDGTYLKHNIYYSIYLNKVKLVKLNVRNRGGKVATHPILCLFPLQQGKDLKLHTMTMDHFCKFSNTDKYVIDIRLNLYFVKLFCT